MQITIRKIKTQSSPINIILQCANFLTYNSQTIISLYALLICKLEMTSHII